MKGLALVLSITAFIVLELCPAFAQQRSTPTAVPVPHLIQFSGVVKDSSGQSMTGINGITFALYRDQEGGVPLWLETQSILLDSNGRYEVLLGTEHSDGVPLDLFAAGEARWLGIHVVGQANEQTRVLMVSVPYALKAADADTVGGLPPSAFVLASPATSPAGSSANVTSASGASNIQSGLTVGGSGTPNFLPLWTPDGSTLGNSVLFQSGTGSNSKIGLNTTTPSTTLDVKGAATVRGSLVLPPTGTATASVGKNSQPEKLAASSYSSATASAVNQIFQWQAEPTGNNSSNPGGTLNLLFGSGSNAASETGLMIGSNGQITFANGQIFPGSGSVTSVGLTAPSSDFEVSGSPITSNGTLGLNWSVAPASVSTPNAIVKRDGSGSFGANTITATTLTGATASFTGNVNSAGIVSGSMAGNNAGAFTDSQQDDYFSAQIGGANIYTEYSYAQPGYATEALASAILVPSNATKHQESAISGYAESQANGNSGNGPNVVGGYFQARAAANGASVWGINPLLTDTVGVSGHWMLNEYDLNLYGNPKFLTYGIYTGGPWSGTPPSGVAPGYSCTTGAAWLILCLNPTANVLQTGIVFSRHSISKTAIQIDGTCNSVNPYGGSGTCGSASISFTGYSSDVAHTGVIGANSNGDLVLSAAPNRAVQLPAATLANISAMTNPQNGSMIYCADCKNVVDN